MEVAFGKASDIPRRKYGTLSLVPKLCNDVRI
jgi:hypothetical protein